MAAASVSAAQPSANTDHGRAGRAAGDFSMSNSCNAVPAAISPLAARPVLRVKVPKAKERALIREFGLGVTTLTEAELTKRRNELKALVRMGKAQ